MLWRLVVVLAGVLATGIPAHAADLEPPTRAASSSAGVTAAQEITLDGMGLDTQTVRGPSSTVRVFFPPPGAALAGSGSFARVFFGHSAKLGPEAAVTVAVNGRPLTSVRLEDRTSAGSVFEVRVPQEAIHAEQPNQLAVHFSLQGSDASRYGRVDGQTLMHYELVGARGGKPEALDAYPYSLSSPADAGRPLVGLMMPNSPDAVEVAAAMRLMADLGRRLPGTRLQPEVVTGDEIRWLRDSSAPALIVGRLDRLISAANILLAAGFRLNGGNWVTPDGATVSASDGLLVATVSPWDRKSPVVLVTGATPEALSKAAAALVNSDRAPLGGAFAIVSEAGARSVPSERTLKLDQLLPPSINLEEGGEDLLGLSFPVPSFDAARQGRIQLQLGSTSVDRQEPGSMVVMVNSQPIGGAFLKAGTSSSVSLELPIAGTLLRPGMNGLSLRLGVPPRTIVRIEGTSVLSLPTRPTGETSLQGLPYPFLDPATTSTTHVVVADTSAPMLTAAASALAALGERSTAAPSALTVTIGGEHAASLDANLIVVGVAGGNGHVDPWGSVLKLRIAPTGEVNLAGRPGGSRLHLAGPLGAAQLLVMPGGAQALWLSATSPAALSSAASVLRNRGLSGKLVCVGESGTGRNCDLAGGRLDAEPVEPRLVRAVVGASLLLLILALAFQLRRSVRASK